MDASVASSGYIGRIAPELHLNVQRARQHLNHPNRENAFYRCIKYRNHRQEDKLSWPVIIGDIEELA